ncbi:MAG TPA: hypothetical protein VF215_08185 [Thermoanaerobaculia bacterium]
MTDVATSSAQTVCAACNRTIDAAAKLCPYCGANPATGERLDTQTLLQEIFRPREMSTSDSVIEYARQRQGIVVAISLFVGFLIIVGVHQFVTRRNANVVSDMPAVPLSEITDVTKKADETTPVAMPDLNFQYNGTPKRMRTYVVERGAITPPEALPAQQPPPSAPAAPAAPRPTTR